MNLCVITDTPGTVALDGERATSRVQIAKTGKFKDPRYGRFSITHDDFGRWQANFKKLSVAGGRAGLPVDVDHGPERTGKTEAAGWITALDVQGDELWATVEWNSLGKELVADRRYLYLSPTYRHNYEDEEGRAHGTALVGVALTNRPFLSMATVSLSQHTADVFAVEDEGSDSRPAMKTLLAKLGLPEDATEEQAVTALAELSVKASPPPTEKTLDQLASEQGAIVLSQDDFRKLQTDAASGAAAAAELHKTRFDSAWATALSQGKVTPAEEEGQRTLYAAAPEATLTALAARPVVVNLERHSAQGGEQPFSAVAAEPGREPVDQDRADLDARATALAAARGIDYADAVILAASGEVA